MSFGHRPMLPHVMRQSSLDSPNKEIQEKAKEMERQGALAASFFVGFPHADIPYAGSSAVVDRGFVTYTNQAKHQMLGVPSSTLENFGAVSQETAEAMARGALGHANADIVVAITGIAGPGGGSAEKPVGLVHFAAASRNGVLDHRERRFGDIGRAEVRRRSVLEALAMLKELAS